MQLRKIIHTTSTPKKLYIGRCNNMLYRAYRATTPERRQQLLEKAQGYVLQWEDEQLFDRLNANYREQRGIMPWE